MKHIRRVLSFVLSVVMLASNLPMMHISAMETIPAETMVMEETPCVEETMATELSEQQTAAPPTVPTEAPADAPTEPATEAPTESATEPAAETAPIVIETIP